MAIQVPSPSLDPSVVDDLSSTLRGQLSRPGERNYDDARKVFNAMIDRRPAVIVRPADAEDIRRTVTFARVNQLPVSVKGGGHKRTREVLQFYPEFAASCPDELSMSASLGRDSSGRPALGIGVCWSGEHEEADLALRPLRDLGPAVDVVVPSDYCALQSAHDAGFPMGGNHYWKSSFFTDFPDDAIDILLHFSTEMPSPVSGIGMQRLHGAAARVDPAATAFQHRRSQSDLLILAQWDDPAETERNVAWARAFFEAMQPFAARGVYVNDLGEEGEDRVRAAYGANYERLAAVKARYDPANLFRSNQNIRPSG